jgi:hypothetical protein
MMVEFENTRHKTGTQKGKPKRKGIETNEEGGNQKERKGRKTLRQEIVEGEK